MHYTPRTKLGAYIILSAQDTAKRWKYRGWRGVCGPVTINALWEEVISELDKTRTRRTVGQSPIVLMMPIHKPCFDQRIMCFD